MENSNKNVAADQTLPMISPRRLFGVGEMKRRGLGGGGGGGGGVIAGSFPEQRLVIESTRVCTYHPYDAIRYKKKRLCHFYCSYVDSGT